MILMPRMNLWYFKDRFNIVREFGMSSQSYFISTNVQKQPTRLRDCMLFEENGWTKDSTLSNHIN
jgi:hypothetical protein